MAKLVLVSFSLYLISLSSVCYLGLAADEKYCVAKPSTSDDVLAAIITYACKDKNVKCEVIQKSGSCYEPNTPINHASVAMNLYYKANGKNDWNCDFNNSGLIAITDPSFKIGSDTCSYH